VLFSVALAEAHVLVCGLSQLTFGTGCPVAAHGLGPGENAWEAMLLMHPVDLLAVEAYRVHQKLSLTQPVTFWERWMAWATRKPDKPSLVIKNWEPATLLITGVGPLDKSSGMRWVELRYQT